MKELINKKKLDNYIKKSELIGAHQFDFYYYELLDQVKITRIYAEEGEEIIVPGFVSEIMFDAWCYNWDMGTCVISIPIGCRFEVDGRTPYGADSLGNHVSEIRVMEGHENYVSKDGVLFSKDMTELLVYPGYKEGETYTIPSSVVRIQEGAFCMRGNLRELNIPARVVEIETCDFGDIMVNVSEENPRYKSVNGSLYSKDGSILYHLYQYKDEDIKIEEGTVLFKGYLFYPVFGSTLYIPDSLIPTDEMKIFFENGNADDCKVIKVPKRLRNYVEKLPFSGEYIYY